MRWADNTLRSLQLQSSIHNEQLRLDEAQFLCSLHENQ
jgi:hypothetical protein